MSNEKIITLKEFRELTGELAREIKINFPNSYLDYAGLIPNNDQTFRYNPTPKNTVVFAGTGGDGVHYSILPLNTEIQPVVMTVPMNFGGYINEFNWILGENLNEFLSLGYYNGWFTLEQLCYNKDEAIKFYEKDYIKEDFPMPKGDFYYIKGLREKLGYNHIPLNWKRLIELEDLYFDRLEFDEEFLGNADLRKQKK